MLFFSTKKPFTVFFVVVAKQVSRILSRLDLNIKFRSEAIPQVSLMYSVPDCTVHYSISHLSSQNLSDRHEMLMSIAQHNF